MKKHLFLVALFLVPGIFGFAQGTDEGQFSGNLQFDGQTYQENKFIGADKANEIMLVNTYANFRYVKGNFSAGTRFEGYMNSLQGFEPVNSGTGFPYAWASYEKDNLSVTVGSFYEQFGSGMVFRAYEDKTLGYDNALNGILLRYRIGNGVTLKGFYGRQRELQWDMNNHAQLKLGTGIVRGIDGEFYLNDIVPGMAEMKTQVSLGASFVSKYEPDDSDKYKLPENVGAGAARFNISRGAIGLSGEYAYKSMDPSAGGFDNSNGNVGQNYIYKNGQGAFVTATYSQKGLGVSLMAKSIDNMNFRSNRKATLNNLSINYIPDITKNQAYAFTAMYPYGTQINGEAGFQAEVVYKVPKGSKLGGKYGTGITLSYSRMFNLEKEAIHDTVPLNRNAGTDGYKTSLLSFGDELFYQDLNIEVNKKFNKNLKGIFTAQYLSYNNSIIHGAAENSPITSEAIEGNSVEHTIDALTLIADVAYRLSSRKALRIELQHLSTQQNMGNWAMAMLEFSIPQWFFILSDQYNYGNDYDERQVHYYKASVVHAHKANRFELGYGKQREGVVCTGGVCRRVPAAYGFTVSITSSF